MQSDERCHGRLAFLGLGPAAGRRARLSPTGWALGLILSCVACAPSASTELPNTTTPANVAAANPADTTPASPSFANPDTSPGASPATEASEASAKRATNAGSPDSAVAPPDVSSGVTDEGTVPTNAAPGWLGIHMRQTDEGVVVANVLRGSPAAAAGLQPGDRVLRIGSRTVADTSDVSSFVQEQSVGTRVNLDVRRGKETRLLYATIVEKPEREAAMRADLVGREAPSISRLKTVQGSVVPAWNQLRGQVVVLYFWASWCVACRALSPTLNEWQEELAPASVNILGVTMDPFEEATRASRQLDFPTYCDESGDVSLSYQGTALPTLIIVDKKSVVREVMSGLNFERLPELKRLVQQLSAEADTR